MEGRQQCGMLGAGIGSLDFLAEHVPRVKAKLASGVINLEPPACYRLGRC